MIRPQSAFSIVCHLIGAIMIIYGIIKLVGYFTRDIYQLAFQFGFAMGIFSIVIGCILLFWANTILELFPALIGVLIMIDGVFKIQTALDARRFGLTKWWLILFIAILAGAAGCLLIVHPMETSLVIMRQIGLNIIIDGALNLWVTLYTVRADKREKEGFRELE